MNRKRSFNLEINIQIGKKLKQRRIDLGFDTANLASRIPCNPSQVSKWENGCSGFTLFKFAQILKALDLTLSDFDEIIQRYFI